MASTRARRSFSATLLLFALLATGLSRSTFENTDGLTNRADSPTVAARVYERLGGVTAPRELTRIWRAGRPVDLMATLGPMRRGKGDPTMRLGPGGLWRVTRTPDGPATLRLATGATAYDVAASAWGPGSAWALDRLPGMLGAGDDP